MLNGYKEQAAKKKVHLHYEANVKTIYVHGNEGYLNRIFDNLVSNEDIRSEKGHICATFVQMNKGATDIILKNI